MKEVKIGAGPAIYEGTCMYCNYKFRCNNAYLSFIQHPMTGTLKQNYGYAKCPRCESQTAIYKIIYPEEKI